MGVVFVSVGIILDPGMRLGIHSLELRAKLCELVAWG